METLSADARLHNEKLLSERDEQLPRRSQSACEALMERFARYDDTVSPPSSPSSPWPISTTGMNSSNSA